MPANGPYLVIMTLASIGLLLFLILVPKLHAFLAMMISGVVLGLAVHMKALAVLKAMQFGFGDALGFIGIVIALGAMLGSFLESSGGGIVLADWLLAKFGRERAVWAVLLTAYLVGLPIYFEVGFMVLVPLVWSLSRESKLSTLSYGLPMAMALSAAHNLVPPHPGPVAAAQLLGADLGRITLYGTILSAIMAVLGGRVFGGWIAKRMYVPVPEIALANSMGVKSANPPSVPVIIFILVVPVFLIFAGTAFGMAKLPGAEAIAFIGHPFTALMVAAGAAIYFFGVRRGMNREQILKLTTDALIPTGTLLAIIGSGGALKQVIVESGVGPYAGKMMASAGLSPIIVAFFISAALRFATGSATVAIITAAGIMAPILKSLSGCSPEMIVLAICDGGVMFSHVNDAGFWMVNNYYGMTVSQTLRTWTVMRMVTAMAGLALILACQAVFG